MTRYICNICGKEFDEYDMRHMFSMYRRMGYGSKHDGQTFSIDICVDCIDRIIDSCKIDPFIKNEEYEGPF